MLPLIRQKLNGTADVQELLLENDHLSQADVVLIGPEENNPVKLVQQITALDKYISVIILAWPQHFNRIKQSVLFAPFIGKNTLCIAYTESLDIQLAVNNAGLRTKQRRSFSKINKIPPAAKTIESSAVKIENFGTFLEQAPIAAFLIDDENNVVAINKKGKSLFNVTENKLFLLSDFLPGLSIQQLKIVSNKTDEISKVIEVKNSFLEIHLSEVNTDEGKTLNILLASDVTEQKQKETALKESEALFRFMADAMPQKVWTADEIGYRNFFNQRWKEYTGLSQSELEGWGWTRIIHPDDREGNLREWKKSVSTGKDFQFEHRLKRHDGEYRWHLVRSVARKDANGKILMWIGTNTDIHEQKAFAEEMERRVRERTFELEKTNSELEQFVYVTSHDLQEPLRKIRMFSEILKDTTTGLDEGARKYVDKISATSFRMATLLRELLNFTQMSKQEQTEKTDLNSIVSKALVDLELTISEKQAVINTNHLPVINAIPVQMHQLFYNLISNALKFSRPGIAPAINITSKMAAPSTIERFPYLMPEKEYVEIVVEDNGIGFDPQYAEQIFHIFQRLHTRNEYSGTGIGLALCKKVVVNHHGSIYAHSEKGKGAAFHVLLPKQ